MIDPFGNYLCQKIFDLISQSDINYVALKLQDKLGQISKNQHGTRSVQKLLEVLKDGNIRRILGENLKKDVLILSKVS